MSASRVVKRVIIAFLIVIVFLLLFGKTIFSSGMGVWFMGSPFDEFLANEMSSPLLVGESWEEEDFFRVTMTEITFSEENGRRLCDIALVAENDKVFADKYGDMELYCEIKVPKGNITEKTENSFTIPEQQSKECHYQFFLPEGVSEFQCQVDIPIPVDSRYRYRNLWRYGTEF